MLRAVHAGANTFAAQIYESREAAIKGLREGGIQGAIIIPGQFSRDVYMETRPRIGLIVDNTDAFVREAYETKLQELVRALNAPVIEPRLAQKTAISVVELYPYVDYMRYFMPGSILSVILGCTMVGGFIAHVDARSRGAHEGYPVTPITKAELILGLNLAAILRASCGGAVIIVIGSLLSGLEIIQHPLKLILLLVLTCMTAAAYTCMVSLVTARISDPLVPPSIVSALNLVCVFSSGAFHPISGFPTWLRTISMANPLAYAVDGFRSILLEQGGLAGIWPDLTYLAALTLVAYAGTALLLSRSATPRRALSASEKALAGSPRAKFTAPPIGTYYSRDSDTACGSRIQGNVEGVCGAHRKE